MNILSSVVLDTIKRTDLTPADKLVLVVLDTKGDALTNRKIAERTGLNEFSVSGILKKLRLRGELPSQRTMAAVAGA